MDGDEEYVAPEGEEECAPEGEEECAPEGEEECPPEGEEECAPEGEEECAPEGEEECPPEGEEECVPEDGEGIPLGGLIKADIRMFSGCRDNQCSSDAHDVSQFDLAGAEGAGGACTHAMLETLADGVPDSWLALLKGMHATLESNNFSQIPQLSSSRRFDVREPFSLTNSEGSGNTRSLLIGINYVGQGSELAGCHNDVTMMKDYIATQGYSVDDADCMVLMDDGEHANPDRESILNGMRWLAEGAGPGDSLFMHFSGHGGHIADTSGDEIDRRDETMVPVDSAESGDICDDEIFTELVRALPEGVTLTVVMDCCHSGTVLDLPFTLLANLVLITLIETGEGSSIIAANPLFKAAKHCT